MSEVEVIQQVVELPIVESQESVRVKVENEKGLPEWFLVLQKLVKAGVKPKLNEKERLLDYSENNSVQTRIDGGVVK